MIQAPIYFVFADGSPEIWNDDWASFNGNYRYGPTATTTVSIGTSYSTAKRNNNYSYYLAGNGSYYLFTFNLNDLTFRIDMIEMPPVVLIGDVNNDGKFSIADLVVLNKYLLGKINKIGPNYKAEVTTPPEDPIETTETRMAAVYGPPSWFGKEDK